ncbi:hypothetical protein BH20VER2_BH20VER2_09830 [soil metagenome]
MKTVTIRDLRQRWPETERALAVEHEIIITRDGQPVAKLSRIVPETKPRPRFDPVAHGEWQRKMSGGKVTRLVDKYLMADREDRPIPGQPS